MVRQAYAFDDASDLVEEGFHIDSIDALNWWLCKIGDLRAAAERQRDVAQAAHERADSLKKEADRLLYGFRGEADPFVRKLLDDKAINPGGRKSLILTGGEVGFRRTAGRVEVSKEAEGDVIRWCMKHQPNAVKTRYELLLTPLKDALLAGEAFPPGITWQEPEEKLWVK